MGHSHPNYHSDHTCNFHICKWEYALIRNCVWKLYTCEYTHLCAHVTMLVTCMHVSMCISTHVWSYLDLHMHMCHHVIKLKMFMNVNICMYTKMWPHLGTAHMCICSCVLTYDYGWDCTSMSFIYVHLCTNSWLCSWMHVCVNIHICFNMCSTWEMRMYDPMNMCWYVSMFWTILMFEDVQSYAHVNIYICIDMWLHSELVFIWAFAFAFPNVPTLHPDLHTCKQVL